MNSGSGGESEQTRQQSPQKICKPLPSDNISDSSDCVRRLSVASTAAVILPAVEVVKPSAEVVKPPVDDLNPTVEVVKPSDQVSEPSDQVLEPSGEISQPSAETLTVGGGVNSGWRSVAFNLPDTSG